jgi:hypothetical protein
MAIFLVRLEGALPSGETWNTGQHFSGGGDVSAVLDAVLTSADILWNGDGGTINGLAGYYPSTITLATAVAYELNPATDKATDRDQTGLGFSGTALDDPLPQEVAVVASLRSGLPGPSGRGRAYLPGPTVASVTATGRLDGVARNDFAKAVAGYLTAMHTNLYLPVLHKHGSVDRTIISVDVGDVFDAQRRRRDKLIESRHSEPVT